MAFEAIVGVLNDSLTITAFGFGVTVPNPIYVIAAVIWYVDRAILLTFETINDINNDCETGNDQSITHDVVGPRVDTTVSSRSTQASLNAHDTNLTTRANTIDTNLGGHNANIDGDLLAHDTNIDGDLLDHDTNIAGDLLAHDTNIDGDLLAHDTNIDGDLLAHDTNIDGDLLAHDTNIDGDLLDHDTNLTTRANTIDFTLANVIEMKRVHLQVIEVTKERYLLGATEAGVPLSSLTLVSVHAGDMNPALPVSLTDVTAGSTITMLQPGIFEVNLVLSGSTSKAKLFQFQVQHNHAALPDHFGTALVSGAFHLSVLGVGQ